MAAAKDSTKADLKAAKKAVRDRRRAASKERRKQMWQVFQQLRKTDKKLLPYILLAVLGPIIAFVAISLVLDWPLWLFAPLGVLIGILGGFIVFGRRAQSNTYEQAEGQPGASAWSLDQLRGQWRVTHNVAGNTHLDVVHRVVGRPGIVLVSDGAPHRVKPMLAQEKKRLARIVGTTPIYEVVVGNDEGQVALKGLNRFITKLPNNISAARMDEIDAKLAAMAARTGAQMPKGPLPGGGKRSGVQRTVQRRR